MELIYLLFWTICALLNAESMFRTMEQRQVKREKSTDKLLDGCKTMSIAGIPVSVVRVVFIGVLLFVFAQDVVGLLVVYSLGLQHGIDCRPLLVLIGPVFLLMLSDGKLLMGTLRLVNANNEQGAREKLVRMSERRHIAGHVANAVRLAVCIIGFALFFKG